MRCGRKRAQAGACQRRQDAVRRPIAAYPNGLRGPQIAGPGQRIGHDAEAGVLGSCMRSCSID